MMGQVSDNTIGNDRQWGNSTSIIPPYPSYLGEIKHALHPLWTIILWGGGLIFILSLNLCDCTHCSEGKI